MKSALNVIILLVFSVAESSYAEESIQGIANKLKTYLFQNYSILIRPKMNQSETLVVNFDIALKQVIDVNVKTQKMTLFLWQRQTWYDDFLSWNPADFGDLRQIFVSPTDIWLPDIIFQNSLDEMDELRDMNVIKVMLLSSGIVTVFMICAIDMHAWNSRKSHFKQYGIRIG